MSLFTTYLKRGAYNSLFYGLSSAIVRAINFLFLPYFLSRLTLVEFGMWDFYQMFFSTGTLLLSSCASTGMIRFYFLYQNEPIKKDQAIGNSLLVGGIGAMLLPLSSLFYNNPLQAHYGVVAPISVSLFTLFSLVLAYLRMKENVVWYTMFFCCQSIIATILTVVGVARGYRLESFFYASCFSFFIFLPSYVNLIRKHSRFSFTILREQIIYSVPLLIYGLLYSGFFIMDRWFIVQLHGYEALGTYSLLWRFGGLFQFAAIAIFDATPIIFYNAQQEQSAQSLMPQLSRFLSLIICSLGIYAIIISNFTILFLFPSRYHHLIIYMPLFFFSLTLLEISRTMQISFSLAIKTFYTPLLALFALICQTGMLHFLAHYNLWCVFIANNLAFFMYLCTSYYLSKKINNCILTGELIVKLFVIVGAILLLIQTCILYNLNLLSIIVTTVLWPFSIYYANLLTSQELGMIQSKLAKLVPLSYFFTTK